MALLHEEDDHNHQDKGNNSSEPEKAHSTGDFVIVAKFGDHVLRPCLASNLLNVIKQVDRQVGRQTKFQFR